MPMDGKLTHGQVKILRGWINQGAAWEGAETVQAAAAPACSLKSLEEMPIPADAYQYWAFRKPVQPSRAARDKPAAGASPGRRLPHAGHGEKGHHAGAGPPIARRWLGGLTSICWALPPTPEQVASFLNDAAADPWERLIDRLLDSPHYGERLGRHWLDVARYADSNGFEHDRDRPTSWRYRDYVIDAFNKETPYNIFIVGRTPPVRRVRLQV